MEPNKDSIEFGKKLLELRNKKDMSQSDIAKSLGIGQTTYAGYENGKRNATISIINMFANFFSVSPDYLLGKIGKNPKDDFTVPSKYFELSTERRTIADRVFGETVAALYEQQKSENQSSAVEQEFDNVLPFRLSGQPASAGHGFDLGPQNLQDIYVRKGCLPRGAKFGVPVAGNSMEPKYHDGDILVVDGQPVDEGEIGVFTLNGDGYVKKLQCGKLVSLNPDYEPIELHEYDQFKHNGRVIGVLDPECIVER